MDDDKDLAVGDVLNLCEKGENETRLFSQARILRVIEKPFGELTEEDRISHESYETDSAMYVEFSGYYQKPIGPETLVKIAWFELIK